MTAFALRREDQSAEPGRIAAKAAFNAARELGLTQAELARAIGVSNASASRMKAGGFVLAGKPLELALCLIRVFRSLDTIAGGESATIHGWISNPNRDLCARPRDLIGTASGLIDVMNYLDAARAPT
ncbi:MAG: antitoxin Xre-like helix-turn-helix domain-containing protein [Pseudorhodobacter sp.]